MGFKSGANGIAKKGHTKGKNLGDAGSHVGIQVGKAARAGKAGGKTDEDMKAIGRNEAKLKANGF